MPAPARASLALFTDLYQLTMLEAYLAEGMQQKAVFSLFSRRLPPERNYLLACGLDSVLEAVEHFQFDAAALEYLASTGKFSQRLLHYLRDFHFTGDIYAVPEGTPVFASEPLIEVVAPLPEAQVIETLVMNQVHVETLVASKAARVVEAARGRPVIEFGLRRSHGTDAGLKAARAAFVAGADATSNVAAGQVYGIPIAGTMAHSYVQAHASEYEAFRQFARVHRETVLLVDTYDTLEGVRQVVRLARELGERFAVTAVRLDSGDLAMLARGARAILDEAGLRQVKIFASGDLDEYRIAELLAAGAPIDSFGVGTRMVVSGDAPSLDLAYKLVAYAGEGRVKLATSKTVLPGQKQVFRIEESGTAIRDVLALHREACAGRPLLVPVMRRGRRLPETHETLESVRLRARAEIGRLSPEIRGIERALPPYTVLVSEALLQAAEAARCRVRPSPPALP